MVFLILLSLVTGMGIDFALVIRAISVLEGM